jgi:hypothetical protein
MRKSDFITRLLEEKFRAMEPKLREAQRAYREAVKRRDAFRKQGREGDDPEKVAGSYRDLVDELFDVKALDPAMGSGHFLAETVDFVTDRMVDFLNGFRWNPVTAPLGMLARLDGPYFGRWTSRALLSTRIA